MQRKNKDRRRPSHVRSWQVELPHPSRVRSDPNIREIWKPRWQSIGDNHKPPSPTNEFDYDLTNGRIAAYAGAEAHGIDGVPVYARNNGWSSGSGGEYALAEGSPGYHAAVKLPNFNDAFAHPDMGAHQSGTPPMEFGVHAYLGEVKTGSAG